MSRGFKYMYVLILRYPGLGLLGRFCVLFYPLIFDELEILDFSHLLNSSILLSTAFKMKGIYLIPSLAIFLSYVSSVHGASPAWGQCGGINYTGDTTCVSGYGCVKVNDCEFDLLFMEFFFD